MKKTVYLRDENYNWKEFQYEGNILEALKDELSQRLIKIGYEASIGDRASIGNRASIGYGASIGNRASIGNEASIGNGASIGYGASIGNRASIGDGVRLITGFYLKGSKHAVTYVGEKKISIGCHTNLISWFKDQYKLLGAKEGYSDSEIEEYYSYILLAEKFAETCKEEKIITEKQSA